ncbi:hypothetical protein KEM60_03244 [Austwickia sp. TVS 96-490-7B]|nr:hypothetical protein [Austwickia sp. TVS 96-490-7B]
MNPPPFRVLHASLAIIRGGDRGAHDGKHTPLSYGYPENRAEDGGNSSDDGVPESIANEINGIEPRISINV